MDLQELRKQIVAARQDLYGAQTCVDKILTGERSELDLEVWAAKEINDYLGAAKWRIDAASSHLPKW
jgi:hypothetical protein